MATLTIYAEFDIPITNKQVQNLFEDNKTYHSKIRKIFDDNIGNNISKDIQYDLNDYSIHHSE